MARRVRRPLLGVRHGLRRRLVLAFVRNFVIGVRVMLLRDKAELARMKDFLDHI